MIQQPAMFSGLFAMGLEIVFYVILLLFILYTLSLAYHWYVYGTSRTTATLSLAVFLLGSAPLLLIMSITI